MTLKKKHLLIATYLVLKWFCLDIHPLKWGLKKPDDDIWSHTRPRASSDQEWVNAVNQLEPRKQEIEDIGILKRRKVASVAQYTKYQNHPELKHDSGSGEESSDDMDVNYVDEMYQPMQLH
jgi:hypothetical protein